MKRAKKSLSQNFIVDKNICKKIVNQTKIKNQIVLEIGPGYGFLTDIILDQKPKKLYLIEKDTYLKEKLQIKYKNKLNVFIQNEDILKYNLINYKNLIVVSNLPYNVSTKIIMYLFEFNKNIHEMVFMIQKEVALKFDYNLPKMNKYKFLTKIVSKYERCFEVSPKVFVPKPKIKSTVVKFEFKKSCYDLMKAKNFSKNIFKNVRKKISNNIKHKNNNVLLNKRVDELSVNELLRIYNIF